MSALRGSPGTRSVRHIWFSLAPLMLALASFLALSGCGFGKRSDATGAFEVTRKFALSLQPQSSVARSSGEVTFMRLHALFPTAQLDSTPFTLLGGTGLDRVFGQMQRPYTALAQVALRSHVVTLCRDLIEGGDQSKVFATDGILVAGETLPADPATLNAFAGARNVWLDLYKPDSPEVQALAKLYADIKSQTQSGDPDLEAKRAVCEAALIAPQFWLGNASATDAIRRVSLEIGRRLPKFSDMARFASGEMKIGDYVADIQSNEPGYWKWLHSLDEEWLGLRPFTNGPGDFRPTVYQVGVGGVAGASLTGGITYGLTDVASVGRALYPAAQFGQDPENCQARAQAFDPDTKYIVWEHKDMSIANDQGPWLLIGAWVRPDSVADFEANYLTPLLPTYPGFTASSLFGLLCEAPGTSASGSTPANNSTWYMCNGLIPMSQAFSAAITTEKSWMDTEITYYQGLYNAELQGQNRPNYVAYYQWLYATWFPSFKTAIDARVYNTSFFRVYVPDIIGSSSDGANGYYSSGFLGYFDSYYRVARNPATGYWPADHRRVRRFAGSGEQNGYSTVRLWLTGQTVNVCNAISRFPVACFHRPDASHPFGTVNNDNWNASMNALALNGYSWVIESIMHPDFLSQYRCGPPSYSAIVSWSGEDAMYPKGSASSLNDYAVNIHEAISSASDLEGAANTEVNTDMHNEPYYLIDYIIKNDLDFTDIVTANYSCGRTNLEKVYKSQDYYLPVSPTSFESSIGTGSDCSIDPNEPRHLFTVKDTRMPLNLLRTSQDGYEGGATPNFDTGSGTMNPRPMSGILTMSAFLSPVSPKMRTVSSRYFTRLLCGEPSDFKPQNPYDSGGQSLHAQYISQSPVHQNHLRSDCRQCHINLDPLASALSASFVMHEGDGTDEIGEILPLPFGERPIYGVRGGGPKGVGALLGEQVSGVREVGAHLAGSREFAHCVVQKAFENVFGRQIGLVDADFVNNMTTQFMSHRRWNRLIKEMVESPNYQRRN